ncbi:uncharacterized protein SCDLUD_001255 [Saccharomycodes ludwigii]|uniref:uncharacterized protein n=1 Tax=Saccharomycodes ludwigii TaxID=36035 RepID=UPI001E8556A6|nr:hypothetical protein SCDLUD_001255 [Saccharomycodes ludwigii]KAH3903611.1 hypothetical protein SCDLUD_001255 [Saccharomycodes ludwigii]
MSCQTFHFKTPNYTDALNAYNSNVVAAAAASSKNVSKITGKLAIQQQKKHKNRNNNNNYSAKNNRYSFNKSYSSFNNNNNVHKHDFCLINNNNNKMDKVKSFPNNNDGNGYLDSANKFHNNNNNNNNNNNTMGISNANESNLIPVDNIANLKTLLKTRFEAVTNSSIKTLQNEPDLNNHNNNNRRTQKPIFWKTYYQFTDNENNLSASPFLQKLDDLQEVYHIKQPITIGQHPLFTIKDLSTASDIMKEYKNSIHDTSSLSTSQSTFDGTNFLTINNDNINSTSNTARINKNNRLRSKKISGATSNPFSNTFNATPGVSNVNDALNKTNTTNNNETFITDTNMWLKDNIIPQVTSVKFRNLKTTRNDNNILLAHDSLIEDENNHNNDSFTAEGFNVADLSFDGKALDRSDIFRMVDSFTVEDYRFNNLNNNSYSTNMDYENILGNMQNLLPREIATLH